MTLGPNPFNFSPRLPTLADIHRRAGELLAYQNQRKAARARATSGEPHTAEGLHLPEEFTQEQEEQLRSAEFQEPYAGEEPEPPVAHPPGSFAPPPPALDGAALHGVAGFLVRTLAPHTEADPAAVLLQFLAAFGNLVGPGPHCRVGATRHGLNLFVILVGESSKARKGTSWRQISSLFDEAAPLWSSGCVTTTRPTPNTILQALRDQQPVTDRRLFLLSEEFASVIQVLGREAGQLSPLLRRAWDGGDLCSHDGHRYVEASSAHISLVGHVTQSELAHHLSRIESHNGFANRCLWTCVRRSQSLPDGGSLPHEQHSEIASELRRTLDWVQSQDELLFSRTPDACKLWNDGYAALSQGREDAYGAATSRAEAQVLRLSAIYAALDRTRLIDACHLQAAFAVWDYCRASARVLFDTAPIDPTAQRIGQALEVSPEGLTRMQIRALFHRHVSKERIDLALEQLVKLGLIHRKIAAGRGRTTTHWTKPQNPETTATGPYGA